MTHEFESNGITEAVASPELEMPIAGIGLVIIHARTGDIWMVQELTDKPSSARRAGQWSIPLETMKEGESSWEAVGGAIAEAFDDEDQDGNDVRGELFSSLSHMNGNSLHSGIITEHEGRQFELNYAILLYDGTSNLPQPFNSQEVTNGQWRDPMTFFKPYVRPFARIIGQEAMREAYVDNLVRFHETPEERRPVFEQGFSIRENYAIREQRPDMK